jgi:hypothetical protein
MPLNLEVMIALASGNIYFTDPKRLNDPFDITPSFEIKGDQLGKERLVALGKKVFGSEYDEVLKRVSYSAESYFHGDDESASYSIETVFANVLARAIWEGVQKGEKTKSIVCLSKLWNNTLLWSHYADSHKGICIEYAWLGDSKHSIEKVNYTEKDKPIDISLLYQMIVEEDETARRQFMNKYYFNKGPSWEYEQEYRILSENEPNECHDLALIPTKIIFGLKTQWILKDYIYRMFDDYSDDFPIKLYCTMPSGQRSLELIEYASDIDGPVPAWPREPSALTFMYFNESNENKNIAEEYK